LRGREKSSGFSFYQSAEPPPVGMYQGPADIKNYGGYVFEVLDED